MENKVSISPSTILAVALCAAGLSTAINTYIDKIIASEKYKENEEQLSQYLTKEELDELSNNGLSYEFLNEVLKRQEELQKSDKLKEYFTEEELRYLEEHDGQIDSNFLNNVLERIENENQTEEISLNEITDTPKTFNLVKTQNGVNYWKMS